MLKIMISNTESIHARAQKAVRNIAREQERYPEWPNEDIAYTQIICGCGRSFWRQMRANISLCRKCVKEQNKMVAQARAKKL